MIQRQYREEELLQFCGRLRPVYRQGEAPIWFAMSSVIPENLVIDDLIHMDDIVTKKSFFWDAVRRCSGIIHPDYLVKVCPELFADRNHAMAEMNFAGFSFKDGKLTGAKSQGFTPYRIQSDRADAYTFVRTSLDDHQKRISEVLEHLCLSYDRIDPVDPNAAIKSLARARTPDNIDIELGKIEDRESKEKAAIEAVGGEIIRRGSVRADLLRGKKANRPTHPLEFTAGSTDLLKKRSLRYADFESALTLSHVWDKIAHEREAQRDQLLWETGEETYEALGAHTSDGA